MRVVLSQCFTMQYCSEEPCMFHINICSAHANDDWRTCTRTEQRCSQRARKSRSKPLRVKRKNRAIFPVCGCRLGGVVFDRDDSACKVESCFDLGELTGSL